MLDDDSKTQDILDIGAITGNWAKNISFSSKDRIKKYYSNTLGAVTEKHSFFYQKNLIDIFLMAMAVGKSLGALVPLSEGKTSNIPKNVLKEKSLWSMISVVLSEDDSKLDTLKDGNEIYRICEGYANGGIETVIDWDETGETGNLIKRFEEKFESFLD